MTAGEREALSESVARFIGYVESAMAAAGAPRRVVDGVEREADILRAAVSREAQPVAPPGWQLVPIGPTTEMLDAAANTEGIKACNAVLATHFARLRDNVPLWPDGNPPLQQAWAAMLAAAPQAGQPPERASI
jgi:hypothetical protein